MQPKTTRFHVFFGCPSNRYLSLKSSSYDKATANSPEMGWWVRSSEYKSLLFQSRESEQQAKACTLNS